MFEQAEKLEIVLPDWVVKFAAGQQAFATIEERMQFVINASRKNIEQQTGGPFAAAVFESETGRLVSLGVNLVTSQKLSILHAEMVAISLAQKKLHTFDLGAPGLPLHELVTSTEPCAMCFGAIPWSGVKRVITAAEDIDARNIGFDEGPKVNDWKAALQERNIEVVAGILREEARQVLQCYLNENGIIYNSREADASS